MVKGNEVCGLTTDPATLRKTILNTGSYASQILRLALEGRTSEQIYRSLTERDVRRAARLLLPVYLQSRGHCGFVGIAVSPELSYDTEAILEEARELHAVLEATNVFLQLIANSEALLAIRRLVADGFKVCVDSIITVGRYRQVAEAYVAGLTDRKARGAPLGTVASIAFFYADPFQQGSSQAMSRISQDCEVALERAYLDVFQRQPFRVLSSNGARPQQLMWLERAPLAGGRVRTHECPSAAGGFETTPLHSELENEGAASDPITGYLEETVIKREVLRYDRALETIESVRLDAVGHAG